MSPGAQVVEGWQRDFRVFAREALSILDTQKRQVPLVLNPMQVALYAALERQLGTLGFIRLIILKSRQLGCTTFVAAYFYWRMFFGQVAGYLLAHTDDAAKTLMGMYHRYHQLMPQGFARPLRRASAHEIAWLHGAAIDGGTASTGQAKRGSTLNLYHGSEVAFWTHYAEHSAGSLEAVHPVPGTAIILESTANGPVGGFYERWRNAQAGLGDYEPLFFPWTLDPACVRPVPTGFALSVDQPNEVVLSEREYQERHGCSMEQMAWRRWKIQEKDLDGVDGSLVFSQEYPITPEEAFLGVHGNSLLSPAQVEAARKRDTFIGPDDRLSPLIMGLDAAPGHSSSASALAFRRGGKCYRLDRKHGMDAFMLTDYVYEQFMGEGAAALGIDCPEGTGEAVYRELQRRPGTAGKVFRVVFGGRSSNRSRWYNKRAEIWHKMATWIADGAAIVDEQGTGGQTLASELLSVHTKRGNERVIQIEGKDEVIKRLGRSPDGADALACTFGMPEPNAHRGGTWKAGTEDHPPYRITRAPMTGRERAGGGSAGVYTPRTDDVAGF